MNDAERRLQDAVTEATRPDGVIPIDPRTQRPLIPTPRSASTFETRPQQDVARKAVTATTMREALQQLLEKSHNAARHAATVAAPLDGDMNGFSLPPALPPDNRKQPLFSQFAHQVVQISQSIDLIEAQLKRMDEMLA